MGHYRVAGARGHSVSGDMASSQERQRLLSLPGGHEGLVWGSGPRRKSSVARVAGVAGLRTRLMTNSVTIYTDQEDGDDITSTSYGPVVVNVKQRGHDWALGWFLSVVSGVLFTTNNFFVKYLDM